MAIGARDLEPARSARELYGTELRRHRQLARMSLDRLSEVVNYSKTHLHGVETAERLPLPPISEKLDVAFGTGELFQGLWGGRQAGAHAEAVRSLPGAGGESCADSGIWGEHRSWAASDRDVYSGAGSVSATLELRRRRPTAS
ncbi:hypothetical protein JCM18897A_33270 [Streptomyces sp. JCM 18897]